MATVKMGALVEEISGPIGQLVFSKWKGRHYARYKAATVTNPMTEKQTEMRAALATSVQEWWKLTDVQRALWEEFAQGKGKARADEKAVGSKCIIKPRGILQSGFNAYIGANQAVASIGTARVDVPSTQPMPPGVDIAMEDGGYCVPKLPEGFNIQVGVTPLVGVYAETYARLWIEGVWAGSHGYIAVLSDAWALGEMMSKSLVIDTIRMGSNGHLEEVPMSECMYIRLQVDLVDVLGESGPPSECAVTHCVTPP